MLLHTCTKRQVLRILVFCNVRCFLMFVTVVCDLLLLKLKRQKNKSIYETYLHPRIPNIGVREGGGEGGGVARGQQLPNPKFWATQIFCSSERKFRQSQFLKTFPCFFKNYFEEICIFYFNLKSA